MHDIIPGERALAGTFILQYDGLTRVLESTYEAFVAKRTIILWSSGC